MARQRESLTELAFVERELSWLADEAAARMNDADLAEDLRRVRDEHENSAAGLSRMLDEAGGEADEVPEELRRSIRALQRQVRHARGQDGVIAGMLDAERADLELHQSVLETGVPEETGAFVRGALAAKREHVEFFRDVAPRMLPQA